MDVIREFDPWNDPLCTCPAKYSLCPYTGCQHGCIYCFASSYIPDFYNCRPKRDLVVRVERDLKRIDKRRVISMSNSSDPYPPLETKLGLTRACLELFVREGCRVHVITKSHLVTRDVDLLSRSSSVVSFTVITLDRNLSEKLEPGAPMPELRFEAMKELSAAGVPVTLRLDPIIPGLNDNEIESLVETAAASGARHVTSSTFKPRPDSWLRIKRVFPELAAEIGPLYFERGGRHHNSRYLPRGLRLSLMERVKEACDKNGLTFASCREGLRGLTSAPTCDGSHLME